MSHFIEKCVCGRVLMQCRCPDPNKEVRLRPGPCACKPAIAPAAPVPPSPDGAAAKAWEDYLAETLPDEHEASADFLAGFRARGEMDAACVPTTWLDELLSGDKKVLTDPNCREIEALLRAIQDRIRALDTSPPSQPGQPSERGMASRWRCAGCGDEFLSLVGRDVHSHQAHGTEPGSTLRPAPVPPRQPPESPESTGGTE